MAESLTNAKIADTYKTLMKAGSHNPVALEASSGTAVAAGVEQIVFGEDDAADVRTALYVTQDRLGIGTATPDCLLELEASSDDADEVLRIQTPDSSSIDSNTKLAIYFSVDDNSDTRVRSDVAGIRWSGTQNWNSSDTGGRLDFLAQTVKDTDPTVAAMSIITGKTAADAGYIGIGTTTPSTLLDIAGTATILTLSCWNDTAGSQSALDFKKSKFDTAVGTHQEVVDGESLGIIRWYGSDGVDFEEAATISCDVDGDPHTGADETDMPGRLIFSTTADNADSASPRMTILSGGNVGIGTTSPDDAMLEIDQNDGTDAALQIKQTGGGDIFRVFDASTEVFTIEDGGNVGIKDTNPGNALDVTGAAGLTTGTAWSDTSDERIKENVQTITGGLDKINALRPISFNYTDEYLKCHSELSKNRVYNSFIAQEYENVFPDAVTEGKKLVYRNDSGEEEIIYDDLKQYTPHDLHMYLVKAVQELSAKVEALENQ